jgi:Na+/H+ antiporter NhaA
MERNETDDQQFIKPIVGPFQEFIHARSSGGVLLLAATVVALVWANSRWRERVLCCGQLSLM